MAVLFIVITGIIFGCEKQTTQNDEWQSATEETTPEEGYFALSGEEEQMMIESEDTYIYVYICGHVVKPDVYQLKQGTRLFEAIREAGGALEEADLDSLNLADTLYDGEKVYVPATGENSGADTAEAKEDGRLNINTATAAELQTLPGIGEAKANAILSYREANGNFSSIEDLLLVPGIKDGIFGQVQSLIRVN
jgi:competence protein ComEA